MMDVLDLHWLKTSINHYVANNDARAKTHDQVICNTDAEWMQKLQMSSEMKCAPGVMLETDFVANEGDAGVAGVV